MAAEIGLSVATKITELLIDPIQRELGYFFCFNNNIQELESRIIELKATKNDVQGREDAEQRMRKTLGQRVELWIEDANGKIAEAENVINDKAQLQKGCFSIKWCPNIRLRFSLGRKGKKLSLVLKELLQSGDSLPHTGHVLPMPPINMSDYNGDACYFQSRGKIMDDIIEMLQDQETMLTGICGMGGLGKTTFAKQLLQKVQDFHKHLFDFHVFVTISSNPNFNTIQQEVVDMLGGSSIREIESEIVRAQHVRNTFSNKKVVVVLDDVWKEFDLNANGFPLTKSDVGYCCKVIYTSRNNDLWANQEGITKKEIYLNILSNEESLNLFRRKVNLQDHDIDFRSKNEIAIGIVDECKGLPLALEVAGGALIKKSKYVWEDMFFKLHSQKHHSKKIHKVLETSYGCLEDPIAKYIFLICCLFNEDQWIPIETLYRYTMSLQLFKGMNDLRHIRNRVYIFVDELIMRNLLMNVEILLEEERVVKMHDVVRDVGLSIAKRENDFNVLICDGVNEPENDIGLQSKAISILFLKRNLKVPDEIELRGPKLELLRLDNSQVYRSNTEISWNLFEGSSDLKVIDIVGGVISDFSYSFSFPYLSKLKMLSLERLNLNSSSNTAFIQHLSCLEILSFRRSKIKVLPNELSELKNLKVLNLTQCKCFISNEILSRLTNLQELYMWGSFDDWKVLKDDVSNTTGRDNNEAELIELNCLQKLWRLELMVNNIEQVPKDARLFSTSRLLKQFKISIGDGKRNRYGWNQIKFESGERQLWLDNIEDNINIFYVIGALIENDITNLYLCNNSRTWEKICVHGFSSSLKDIVLKQCQSVTTLFTPSQSSSQISHIEETNGYGCYLRRIEICECNEMRNLCSTSTSMHLKNLQILVLKKCEMMEEVVNTCNSTEKPENIEFNALETLELCDLGRLKYFSKEINEIHFLRLRSLKLQGLEQFIFPSKIEIPHLMELEIISMPNITTLCNIANSSLQKLKIVSCDNFKYVFSSSFIKNILRLESLTIIKCKMLKGVIGVPTSTEEQWKESIEFPKLIVLDLESLDKLVSFVIHVKNLDEDDEKEDNGEEKLQNSLFYCDEDNRVLFPCLDRLIICELSKINQIIGWKVRQEGGHVNNDKEHQTPISLSLFPKLKWLELTTLSNLIHVYESNHPELGVSLFQNIKYMYIKDCGKVRYLFTENIGRVVVKQLELLDITNCPMMEVVMKSDAEKDEDYDDDKARGRRGEGIICVPNTHFLPRLENLRLIDIPCLRSFGDVGYTWALPSLICLVVSACPKLESLSPGYLDSPKLYNIWYNNKERNVENWNGDINTLLGDLFIQKSKGPRGRHAAQALEIIQRTKGGV